MPDVARAHRREGVPARLPQVADHRVQAQAPRRHPRRRQGHTPIGDETARTALSELLDVASELLIGGGGLGLVKYSHRAASYYGLRREVVSSDKWPPLLKELGGVIAKDGGAAADLVRAFAALDDALRAAVQSLWEKTDDAPAAELAKAGIENSCRTTAAPKLNTVRVGPPEARRTVLEVSVVAWLELLEILAAPVAAAAKAAAAGDWSRLRVPVAVLYALPVTVLAKFAREQKELGSADGDMAMQRYYRLRVWCGAAAGKKDEAGAMLAKEVLKRWAAAAAAARRAAAAAPPPAASGSSAARGTPPTIVVSGAGCAEANGRYALQGTYQQAPRWVHQAGQLWLIRYRLPSGTNWWYIADKDQLNVNDGDLYRVRAVPIDEFMPPSTGWSLAKDGRPPMPSFEFVYDRPAPPPSPEQPRRSFFGQLLRPSAVVGEC